MSRLEIILICVSCVSVGLNVLFFAYARSAITRLLTVSEELGDLQEMISRFSEHVRSVYSLEMFYGDETLQGLIEHSKKLKEEIDNFNNILLPEEEEEEELLEESE